MPLSYLEKYQSLLNDAEIYRSAHQEQIEKELEEVNKKEIVNKLTKMLELKVINVWCRNGDVCESAELCKYLTCEFKDIESDIPNGCSKCLDFQVTCTSHEWSGAHHLFPLGKVS